MISKRKNRIPIAIYNGEKRILIVVTYLLFFSTITKCTQTRSRQSISALVRQQPKKSVKIQHPNSGQVRAGWYHICVACFRKFSKNFRVSSVHDLSSVAHSRHWRTFCFDCFIKCDLIRQPKTRTRTKVRTYVISTTMNSPPAHQLLVKLDSETTTCTENKSAGPV